MKGPHCTHRRNTQLQSAVISCGSAVEEAAACQSQTHTHKVVDNGWEKTFEWENALVLALPLRANLDSERESWSSILFRGGLRYQRDFKQLRLSNQPAISSWYRKKGPRDPLHFLPRFRFAWPCSIKVAFPSSIIHRRERGAKFIGPRALHNRTCTRLLQPFRRWRELQ